MGANSLESKPERLNFISPEGALTRATRLPTRSSIAITTRVLTAGRKHEPKIEGIDIADKKPIPGTRRISAKLGEQHIKDRLIEYGGLSTQQLQDLTGMNVNQVRNRIRNLIDMGEAPPTASASSRNREHKIAG